MSFKDELKQEYHKYQEKQQKIAAGIHTLSEKFKDKTYQTSLKT